MYTSFLSVAFIHAEYINVSTFSFNNQSHPFIAHACKIIDVEYLKVEAAKSRRATAQVHRINSCTSKSGTDHVYITNLLRLNRKWSTYNRGSNDNFKSSWINYFPNCHNGFRKRLLSIDVRFPSINAKQAIGNIVNMIRKQD